MVRLWPVNHFGLLHQNLTFIWAILLKLMVLSAWGLIIWSKVYDRGFKDWMWPVVLCVGLGLALHTACSIHQPWPYTLALGLGWGMLCRWRTRACTSGGAHVGLALCAGSWASLNQVHSPAPCTRSSTWSWSSMDTACSIQGPVCGPDLAHRPALYFSLSPRGWISLIHLV